jgi:hypothetical protein
MVDSLGAINRKEIHITPWGTPHPHCPGCHQLPKSVPQSHACPELNGLLTTARAKCPFCEEGERAEGAVDKVDKEESRNEIEIAQIGSADEFGSFDPSSLALKELERKASEFRALEAEAEAREAKAQERLRQVEARLRQEMSLRSEVERKSREIEEDLKRQAEIEQSRIEAAIKTAEVSARLEEEMKARIASEEAKAEAEAKLREMEARAAKDEENHRRIEEKYKVEIDWIRAELEEMAAAARQAEDNYKAEMARITAEAESRAYQVEMNARQFYQIKVDEALASAQAAIYNLDETRRKLSEIEVRYREMEIMAHQAETRSRQLFQILKLSLSSAEEIFAETPNLGDEDEKDAMVIPLDLPTNEYSDDFSSETPEPAANDSVDYEDILFSDRMKALLEAATRANGPDD